MAGVRLLLDEDVPILLARTLRQRGHDVVHACEVGLQRTHDAPILEAAVSRGRTIVTHNVIDYMPLAEQYGHAGKHHCGMAFSPQQIEFRDLFERTLRFLSDRTPEDMRDAIVWL